MDDVIYRQDAIDAVEESRRLNHHQDGKAASCHEYEHRHFIKILSELPSAEPERKKGVWINDCCSICGYGVEPWNNTPYCPNCGADMRGEQE